MNVLTGVGQAINRYGLALTLAWIGFGKYIKVTSTAAESDRLLLRCGCGV